MNRWLALLFVLLAACVTAEFKESVRNELAQPVMQKHLDKAGVGNKAIRERSVADAEKLAVVATDWQRAHSLYLSGGGLRECVVAYSTAMESAGEATDVKSFLPYLDACGGVHSKKSAGFVALFGLITRVDAVDTSFYASIDTGIELFPQVTVTCHEDGQVLFVCGDNEQRYAIEKDKPLVFGLTPDTEYEIEVSCPSGPTIRKKFMLPAGGTDSMTCGSPIEIADEQGESSGESGEGTGDGAEEESGSDSEEEPEDQSDDETDNDEESGDGNGSGDGDEPAGDQRRAG